MTQVLHHKNALVISNWDESLLDALKKYNIIRNGTNKPELRQKGIHELLSNHYTIIKPNLELTQHEIVKLGIHPTDYLQFLDQCYDTWSKMPDEQYVDLGGGGGLVPLNGPLKQNSLFFSEIVSKLPIWKRIGYYAEDKMSPIYANTYTISMQCANNCYVACNYIQDYDVVYCCNTMPCHHATYSSYGGYCFINSVAIATQTLVNRGKKVAVVDVDYHAGSLSSYFKNHKDVLTISIHADPCYDYPSFYGFPSENTMTNVNILFPRKATWTEYEPCLTQALDKIKMFDPDVIIVSFGGDTYNGDSDASVNYGCALELQDYIIMGQKISQLNKKVIVASQGGYVIEKMPQITLNLLIGLTKEC